MQNQSEIIVGRALMRIDGVDVGYTQGGVSFRKGNSHLDIKADQAVGTVRKEITDQVAFVQTTLLQGTLLHLRKAMGEAVAQQFSGSALSVGAAAPAVVEHAIVVTGYADSTRAVIRTYTFYRCVAVEEVEHMIGSREAASIVPVVFEVLKDEVHDNTFFVITDN